MFEYEVFEETARGPSPGRLHYVVRNTRGPSLCGLSQIDDRIHRRFVALMLPVNLERGTGFEAVEGEKCLICIRLRRRDLERH